MATRARRPGKTELSMLLAGAGLLGLAACSSDLFHSTDWPTQCDVDASAPGCPETGSSSSSSSSASGTASSTTSASSSSASSSSGTTTTGAGGAGGAGGGTSDAGMGDGG